MGEQWLLKNSKQYNLIKHRLRILYEHPLYVMSYLLYTVLAKLKEDFLSFACCVACPHQGKILRYIRKGPVWDCWQRDSDQYAHTCSLTTVFALTESMNISEYFGEQIRPSSNRADSLFASRKHTYIILTPLNPTFI